ncbi:hypothetical protein HON22_00265 [Candidatus Peregrinibacteria bacterium]|jgi:hypothetical protein|nr:hypothetical protein [Candidatus Peregrinibacteria bacterium]
MRCCEQRRKTTEAGFGAKSLFPIQNPEAGFGAPFIRKPFILFNIKKNVNVDTEAGFGATQQYKHLEKTSLSLNHEQCRKTTEAGFGAPMRLGLVQKGNMTFLFLRLGLVHTLTGKA